MKGLCCTRRPVSGCGCDRVLFARVEKCPCVEGGVCACSSQLCLDCVSVCVIYIIDGVSDSVNVACRGYVSLFVIMCYVHKSVCVCVHSCAFRLCTWWTVIVSEFQGVGMLVCHWKQFRNNQWSCSTLETHKTCRWDHNLSGGKWVVPTRAQDPICLCVL